MVNIRNDEPPTQNVLCPPHPETECQLSLTSAQGHGIFTEVSPGTVNDTVFPQTPAWLGASWVSFSADRRSLRAKKQLCRGKQQPSSRSSCYELMSLYVVLKRERTFRKRLINNWLKTGSFTFWDTKYAWQWPNTECMPHNVKKYIIVNKVSN